MKNKNPYFIERIIATWRLTLAFNSQSKIGTILWLTIIMICFATNSVITRYLVLGNFLHPFTLTVIRFVSGFFMLQIIVSFASKTFPLVENKSKEKSRYILGALFLGVYAFSISYGYAFISAAAGALIFYAFVVLTMTLFSVVSDKRRLTFQMIFGQLLGLMGVLGITSSGLKSVTLLGVFLMALTGTAWGLYSVHGRKFKSPFVYTYNSFLLFGGISLALVPFGYSMLGENLWANISLMSLGWALYLGMISTALSYVLWHKVMKKIQAFRGGVAQLIVPVLTAFMGVLFLGEEINTSLVLGGILVLIGIGLNIFERAQELKQTPLEITDF